MMPRNIIVLTALIIPLLIVGCQKTTKQNDNCFSYQPVEYVGDFSSSYRDYFASKTGETIRLYDNNEFEYYYNGKTIKQNVVFYNNYFSLLINQNEDYSQNSNEHYSYIFLFENNRISLCEDLSLMNDFYFKNKYFEYISDSSFQPLYNYQKKNAESINFTITINNVSLSKEEILEALSLQSYITNIASFKTFSNLGYSSLVLTCSISDFEKNIKTMKSVTSSILLEPISYCFYASPNVESVVNIKHYGLTSDNEIKEASQIATLRGNYYHGTSKAFSSYASLFEYATVLSETKDENGYSYDQLFEYVNDMDQSIFESNNLVFTEAIISSSTSEEFVYSATYFKNAKIYVVFEKNPDWIGGWAAITQHCYLIMIPKNVYSVTIDILK